MITAKMQAILKEFTKEQLALLVAEHVKRNCPNDATKATIEVTADGVEVFVTTTGEGFLRAKGTNMRNLRGEWILKGGAK